MAAQEVSSVIHIGKKEIKVVINHARKYLFPGSCFVLGHGASGDAASGNLPLIAKALSEAGLMVLRYTCYGQLPARVKVLQGILDSNHSALSSIKHWVLSGHSMGGRTACSVARMRQDVRAVVLFSFPLHSPGEKPKAEGMTPELRDADLVALQIPVMIVRGTKDPFSNGVLFDQVMQRMASSKLEVETVEGGDHSLGTQTKLGKDRFEKWKAAVEEFVSTVLKPAEGDFHNLAPLTAETCDENIAQKSQSNKGRKRNQDSAEKAMEEESATQGRRSGRKKTKP